MKFENGYARSKQSFLKIAKLYRDNGLYKQADEIERLADCCGKKAKTFYGIFGFFSWLWNILNTREEFIELAKEETRMVRNYLRKVENIGKIYLKI